MTSNAKIQNSDKNADDLLAQASIVFQDSGLVVFPTETVYGIGASVSSPIGVQKLREFKSRQDLTPFTLHLHSPEQAADFIDPTDTQTLIRIQKLMPGPITCIIPVTDEVIASNLVKLGLPETAAQHLYHQNTIGLRCPAHSLGRDILAAANAPVVASSANIKGSPPPHDLEHAVTATNNEAELYVDGGQTRYTSASTIIKLTNVNNRPSFKILREGIWDERIIRDKIMYRILFVCTGNTCRSPMAEAIAKDLIAKQKGVHSEDLPTAGITVSSAGVYASEGEPATSEAVEAMKSIGINFENHHSTPLNRELVDNADEIYCMTYSHRQTILQAFPTAELKMKMLRVDDTDVPDPIGYPLEHYKDCAAVIRQNINQRLQGNS